MKSLALFMLFAAAMLAQPATACVTNADCDDNDVCNGVETCQAGVCVPGGPLPCDDLDPCTTNTCDSSAGCVFVPSDGCMIGGRKLKMGARSSKLRLTVQPEPDIAGVAFPANLGPNDPVLHGASIRVFSTEGDTFDTTYALPKGNWKYRQAVGENSGYAYKDLAGTHGPIKIAIIRNGRPSKVRGSGPELGFSLGGDPRPVNVVLQFGARQYCLSYGGIANFNPSGGYKAKKAPPPPACPFP